MRGTRERKKGKGGKRKGDFSPQELKKENVAREGGGETLTETQWKKQTRQREVFIPEN